MVLLLTGGPGQEPLEAFDDSRPGDHLHRCPRLSPHRRQQVGIRRELHRRRDEALPVALPDRQAAHAVVDVDACCGVVVRDHAEAARHRFQGDVAERLRLAGEQEDVGRGIVRGEVVPRAESGEDEIGMVAPERRAEWPVADEHEAQMGVHPAHRLVRLDREADILLGGESSDVQSYQVSLGCSPRYAQGLRASRRIEPSAIDAAADHAEVHEARGRELGAQTLGRDDCSRAGVVEAPEVGGRRIAQPARAIVADIGMEVGVKAAVDGHAEGGPRAQRRPPEWPFRRDVHGVRTAPRPGGAQHGARRQPELQPSIARQPDARDQRRRRIGAGP
jgi:hypothetical protein